MNLTLKSKKTTSKDGTKHYTNFYLVMDSGMYVAIKPSFISDYKTLVVLATPIQEKKEVSKKNPHF